MGKINTGLNLQGQWQDDKKLIKVNVQVIVFEEDNLYYAYIPALDLQGYGNTETEALDSLRITMDEFLRYTCNKSTLMLELKRLGWKVKKEKKKYEAPNISDQLISNDQLKDIINNKQYTTTQYAVNMPAFA